MDSIKIPTGPFTTLEPEDPEISELYVLDVV